MQLNLINRSKNVLYVEDDFDDQQFFQESLEVVAPNTNCFIANDAEEARALFKDLDVALDYIFLDINMPGADGITLLREIKKQKDLKSIPVIMCSTSCTQREIQLCKELGALEYITKPNTFQGMCNILNAYFN
jgi:CheY-like chemotaxis protein